MTISRSPLDAESLTYIVASPKLTATGADGDSLEMHCGTLGSSANVTSEDSSAAVLSFFNQ